MTILVRGTLLSLLKLSPHYSIESTLQFDDIEVVSASSGLLPHLWWFKGDICSQGNGV